MGNKNQKPFALDRECVNELFKALDQAGLGSLDRSEIRSWLMTEEYFQNLHDEKNKEFLAKEKSLSLTKEEDAEYTKIQKAGGAKTEAEKKTVADLEKKEAALKAFLDKENKEGDSFETEWFQTLFKNDENKDGKLSLKEFQSVLSTYTDAEVKNIGKFTVASFYEANLKTAKRILLTQILVLLNLKLSAQSQQNFVKLAFADATPQNLQKAVDQLSADVWAEASATAKAASSSAATAAAGSEEKKEVSTSAVRPLILSIFKLLDADNTGFLTANEIKVFVSNEPYFADRGLSYTTLLSKLDKPEAGKAKVGAQAVFYKKKFGDVSRPPVTSGDNQVSLEEFNDFFKSWSDEELKKISVHSFELEHARNLKNALVKFIFDSLDQDKNGSLDVDEVGVFMQNAKIFFQRKEFLHHLDSLEKDGKIRLRELALFFNSCSITELAETASPFLGFDGAKVQSYLQKYAAPASTSTTAAATEEKKA